MPAIWYAGRPIGLNVGAVFSMAWRYVTASLVAVLVTHFTTHQIPALYEIPGMSGAILRIALVSTFVAFLYLSSVVILHGGFAPLLQIAGLFGEMVRSGKPVPG